LPVSTVLSIVYRRFTLPVSSTDCNALTESFASRDAALDARTAAERCAGTVRRHDRDRYLADLFAPQAARAALFALHAFNLEVARIPEAVSELLLGRIRLQWWRESLDGIYAGDARRHDVVLALAAAVAAHDLPRAPFDAVLDAREADMEDGPPADLGALLAYAAGSGGALARLGMIACGGRDDASLAAADAAGTAQALAGLLRAVPFHAAQRRVYLPRSVLREAGLSEGDVIEGRNRAALVIGVRPVVDEARKQVALAREGWDAAPKGARAALLPAALAASALRGLGRAGFDPHAMRQPGPLAVQCRLAWANRTGRF
jgi:NADH dehydrogenase [ubiquinone] 1 alpha subcomplex assembly factor 6